MKLCNWGKPLTHSLQTKILSFKTIRYTRFSQKTAVTSFFKIYKNMKKIFFLSFWIASQALMAQKNTIPADILEQYPQIAEYLPESTVPYGASDRSDLVLDSILTYSFKGADSILTRREIFDNSVPNKRSIISQSIQGDGSLGDIYKTTYCFGQQGRLISNEISRYEGTTFVTNIGFQLYWNDISNALDSLYVYSRSQTTNTYYNNERYYYKFNSIIGMQNDVKILYLDESGTVLSTLKNIKTFDTSDRIILSYTTKEENGIQIPYLRTTTTYSSDTLDLLDEYFDTVEASWMPYSHVVFIFYLNTQKDKKSLSYLWNQNTSSWEKRAEHFRFFNSQINEIRLESYFIMDSTVQKITTNTTYVEDQLINLRTVFVYDPNLNIAEILRSYHFYSDSSGFHQPPVLLGNPTTVNAYPNPASQFITIDADDHFIQNAEIWDTQGHLVRGFQNINNTILQFNREALSKGIYTIRLEIDGGFVFKKIILE